MLPILFLFRSIFFILCCFRHTKRQQFEDCSFLFTVFTVRIAILPLRIYLVSFFSYCCMRCVCLPQNQYLQIKNLGSFSAWQSRAFLLFIRIHFTTSLSHNNFFSLALLLFHAIRLYYFGVLKCLKHLLRLVCYSRIWSSFRIEHVILFPFVTKIGPWWFLYFFLSPFHSILLCSLVVLLRFGVMLLCCSCFYFVFVIMSCLHLTWTVFPLSHARPFSFLTCSFTRSFISNFSWFWPLFRVIRFTSMVWLFCIYLFVPFGIIIGEAIFMSTEHLLKHNTVMCIFGCSTGFINCNKYTTQFYSLFFGVVFSVSFSCSFEFGLIFKSHWWVLLVAQRLFFRFWP